MRKLGCALGGGSEAQRGLHVNTLVDMELQRTEDDSAKYLRGGGGAFASGDPIVMLLVQWHSDAHRVARTIDNPQTTIIASRVSLSVAVVTNMC